MQETIKLGIGVLLICFMVVTIGLNSLRSEKFPETYSFKQDPFWYIIGTMLVGGIAVVAFMPPLADSISTYGYFDVTAPIAMAVFIYFCYLLDVPHFTNLVTYGCAFAFCCAQPDTFNLFPEHLSLWQNRFLAALIIFIVSKGLGLLNGIGGVASIQFIAIMILSFILMYIGALPQILGGIALAYAGAMLAFAFFSWPPEKLIMSTGAFSALGFVMGCFMINGAVEYAEISMFVGAAYLFTETGLVFYRSIGSKDKDKLGFMRTSYFQISNNGIYDTAVVFGVLKILFVNVVLAMIQTASVERLAFPLFAVALNIWFLSILSGDTKPEELLSISKWSKKAVKEALSISKKQKNTKQKKSKKKGK